MKMNRFSLNAEETKLHLISLFILSLYYLIPYLLVGELISSVHDILEKEVVSNHIIGRFLGGDFNSVNLLLGGEIEWYSLWRTFQPLILLYTFFEAEVAFWLTDIIVRLIAYICLFKLSRKLDASILNSVLIAAFFASTFATTQTVMGVGIASLPYPIYLILKNKNLNIKNYFILALIGANTDLVRHISIIPIIFFVSLILNPKYKKYNLKIFLQISLILLLFIFISNSNLFYAQLFLEPTHRTEFFVFAPDLKDNFYALIKHFFSIPNVKNPYFIFTILVDVFIFTIILLCLFSKNTKAHFILLVIFTIFFIYFLYHLEFFVSIRNNSQGILKTLNLSAMGITTVYLLYSILFIITSQTKPKISRYLVCPLLFLSIINLQISPSFIPLGKHYLSYERFNDEQKKNLRKFFHNKEYNLLIENIIKFRKNIPNKEKQNFKSSYTFKGYYNYENYKYIKTLVGDSRTLSIGLDPMVAVMNNLKVLGGYYNIYPLSYKIKFRKIIEKQLDHYQRFKKDYDFYGHRVYTYVIDPDVIKINFAEAKLLGADYVISKYQISNEILEMVCKKCNNDHELFLYKIKNQ